MPLGSQFGGGIHSSETVKMEKKMENQSAGVPRDGSDEERHVQIATSST